MRKHVDSLINNEIRKIIRNQVNKYSCGERKRECVKLPESGWGPGSPESRVLAFLERLSHGAIPWEQFNWLKKPASCPKTPLYPPPTVLSFFLVLSLQSSAGHFKPFNPPCRGSSTSNWMPPRKAWPLSWSIPLGTSNCTARRSWLYRTEWRFPFAERATGLLLFRCARHEEARGFVTRENGALELCLKIPHGVDSQADK